VRAATRILLSVITSLWTLTAAAQTVKIGLINTYSGPLASNGEQIQKAIDLFMKLNESKLPQGVKLEFIKRDDTGINPETAKRLATELVVREKVQLITGVVWTPNAAAIAPVVTEAKVPFVIMNAGTAFLTTLSPYIARTSFTLWQSSYPMGDWAAKKYKSAYIAVADFGPGHQRSGNRRSHRARLFYKRCCSCGGCLRHGGGEHWRHSVHSRFGHRDRSVSASQINPRECYGTHDADDLPGFHCPRLPRHGFRNNATRMFPIGQGDTAWPLPTN